MTDKILPHLSKIGYMKMSRTSGSWANIRILASLQKTRHAMGHCSTRQVRTVLTPRLSA